MHPLIKNTVILRIVLGYLLGLLFSLGIVFLAFSGLNKINATIEQITNRLTAARSLAQGIDSQLQLVQFYADRYQRLNNQTDLDIFYDRIADLKEAQQRIASLIGEPLTQNLVLFIQQETERFSYEFDDLTKLIMVQQSLLSTTLTKQELLIVNQISAIRINIAYAQIPEMYLAFENATTAFRLMRLYQFRYLSEHDEKYFVMFRNNYFLSRDSFNNLIAAMEKGNTSADVIANVSKAEHELEVYYQTFLDIHEAGLARYRMSENLKAYETSIVETAAKISRAIEDEYEQNIERAQSLVVNTKFQLLAAIAFVVVFNLLLIVVVLRKIITPVFSELQELSNLDGLTRVANRRALDIGLEKEELRAKNNARPLSMILCDVDFFKSFNDSYGHQKGDECLQEIANALTLVCNRPEDFVARYGGEEFAVLLPNTDSLAALDVANRIRESVENLKIPHRVSSISDSVTVSVGVSTMAADDDSDAQALVKNSDTALYKAKRHNRNCVFKYP